MLVIPWQWFDPKSHLTPNRICVKSFFASPNIRSHQDDQDDQCGLQCMRFMSEVYRSSRYIISQHLIDPNTVHSCSLISSSFFWAIFSLSLKIYWSSRYIISQHLIDPKTINTYSHFFKFLFGYFLPMMTFIENLFIIQMNIWRKKTLGGK